MPDKSIDAGNNVREVAAEVEPGTIYSCWMKYSAAAEASDKAPETLKKLWDEYIATLKKAPRTISGCMREYQDAVEALGPASKLPETKSGLWKTYMTLVKDYPQTPENVLDAGWTAPHRGDALGFSASGSFETASDSDVVTALPSSLMISRPDFITPGLCRDEIARLARDSAGISTPGLWDKTARNSNVLRVRLNDQYPSEHNLDIDENDCNLVVTGKLRLAVRRALSEALKQIDFMEERHEEGTAEPGPYRLAFNLAEVEKEGDSAKYMRDHGNPRADVGK